MTVLTVGEKIAVASKVLAVAFKTLTIPILKKMDLVGPGLDGYWGSGWGLAGCVWMGLGGHGGVVGGGLGAGAMLDGGFGVGGRVGTFCLCILCSFASCDPGQPSRMSFTILTNKMHFILII